MSFMQHQVVEGLWYKVEGRDIDFLPHDLFPSFTLVGRYYLDEHPEQFNLLLDGLGIYLSQDERDVYAIELLHGFGARVTAPGYLDGSDWSVFRSRKEAMDYLAEYFE